MNVTENREVSPKEFIVETYSETSYQSMDNCYFLFVYRR